MGEQVARSWWLAAAAAALCTGCDTLDELTKNPPQWPFGDLNTVLLVKAPTFDQLAAWTCFDFGGDADTCGLLGYDRKPPREKMAFGFDIVFDLFNPNTAFSIPLVEMLLGLNVYEAQNLGVLCVSFCDPAEETCDPAAGAEDACKLDEDVEDIKELDDLIPTVDELLDLAGDLAEGNWDDNFAWRTIPQHFTGECYGEAGTCTEEEIDGQRSICCDGACEPLEPGCSVGKARGRDCAICDGHVEAHIQFDLDIDTTLGILEQMFVDAFEAVINLRPVRFVIPYAVDGSLFFQVPTAGRAAVGFGPFDDEWKFSAR